MIRIGQATASILGTMCAFGASMVVSVYFESFQGSGTLPPVTLLFMVAFILTLRFVFKRFGLLLDSDLTDIKLGSRAVIVSIGLLLGWIGASVTAIVAIPPGYPFAEDCTIVVAVFGLVIIVNLIENRLAANQVRSWRAKVGRS